jgi:hypothetical protein
MWTLAAFLVEDWSLVCRTFCSLEGARFWQPGTGGAAALGSSFSFAILLPSLAVSWVTVLQGWTRMTCSRWVLRLE